MSLYRYTLAVTRITRLDVGIRVCSTTMTVVANDLSGYLELRALQRHIPLPRRER